MVELLQPTHVKFVGLPVQVAVSVTLVPTMGVALLEATVQETGGGSADCQFTVVVVTELAPLMLAVTEYVFVPVVADVAMQALPLGNWAQPVQA